MIAKGHVVWVCQAGDSPVACRGQTGQGSCGMDLEGRVVPDRKEVHEHKRGDGHWRDVCWAIGKGQSGQCGRCCL